MYSVLDYSYLMACLKETNISLHLQEIVNIKKTIVSEVSSAL